MTNRNLVTWGSIILLILLAGLIFALARKDDSVAEGVNEDEQVFCTMDAKMCPDGSYVGRVPPDCEFQACPTEAPAVIDSPSTTEE